MNKVSCGEAAKIMELLKGHKPAELFIMTRLTFDDLKLSAEFKDGVMLSQTLGGVPIEIYPTMGECTDRAIDLRKIKPDMKIALIFDFRKTKIN
jgi:hypothetical protein